MASYREELEAWGKTVGSDGCSSPALQLFYLCCLEHDFAYVHATTFRGVPVTKAQADQRFRDCIQRHSTFRWLSPMSWWRYWAVRKFGRGVWKTPPKQPLFNGAVYDTQAALMKAAEARRLIFGELYS